MNIKQFMIFCTRNVKKNRAKFEKRNKNLYLMKILTKFKTENHKLDIIFIFFDCH